MSWPSASWLSPPVNEKLAFRLVVVAAGAPEPSVVSGAVVSGSILHACTAGVAQPSHVLIAMGADPASARGSLRLSLGHTSTESDVEAALAVLPAAVERARQAALASLGAAD